MTLDELKAEVAQTLDVEADSITNETSQETEAKWDSMASMTILSILDQEVDSEIEPEEAEKLTSFGAIVAFAKARGILTE